MARQVQTPHPLRLERQRRNLSQKMLADFAQLGLSTVVRAERGERISADARQRICDFLEKSSQELGLVDYGGPSTINGADSTIPQSANGGNDVNRRQALKQIGIAGVAAIVGGNAFFSTDSWEQLSLALRKTSVVEEATLQNLESITRGFWQLRATLPPRDIAQSVLAHLQTVTQMLRQSLPELMRQRLCAIAGETAQLLGQMAFDMNDHAAAQSYYKVSIEAAQEAQQNNLCAITLGRASLLPINSVAPENSVPLLRKAQLLAQSAHTGLSRAWLLAIEAESWAKANNADECARALDHAEESLAPVASNQAADGDPYWTEFTPVRLNAYKGACFIRLGQSRKAIQALSEALALASSHSLRPRAIMLTDLAKAYVEYGEIEMGCQTAVDALQLAHQTKSPMVYGRIQDVRRQLQPYESHLAVKVFDEQLLTYLAEQLLIA